jgi:glycosyltransferase involved in cell wall biosynthesis
MWKNRPSVADQDLEPRFGAGAVRQPVVWFEVEDFLRYFENFPNPTGLQRVAFEIYAEAERLYGPAGRVKFCRLNVYTRQFMPADFDAIVAAYDNPSGASAPWDTIWAPARFWQGFPGTLVLVMRHPGFFLSIIKGAFRDLIASRFQRRRFERSVQPGDIVVSLGAPWGIPRYMTHIGLAKRRYGIKFAILIHDLIPLENESFVEPWHAVRFRDWLAMALSNADVVFTVSKYSRSALVAAAALRQWSLPRVEVLKLGVAMSRQPVAVEEPVIKFPERFVLFVSTIEIRKNHQLLVGVWRRLLQRHGAEAVPVLIFAGQVGWKVEGLLADLASSDYLDGKVELRRNLSDAELQQAYCSCLFTVFPSLSEGWGLPIAESLVHGKICVASNRTSIPEVGGDFVDYFDPANEDDAVAKIERVLLDPAYLTSREARIRAEYRFPTWAACAVSLVGALDRADSVISQPPRN